MGLDSSMTDGAVMVDHFKLYRRDRKHRRGGNILVHVSESIRSHRKIDLEHDRIETIQLELHIEKSATLTDSN